MRLLFAAALILASTTPSVAGNGGRQVSLAVQVFPCRTDEASAPTLRIADVNSRFKTVPVSARWLRTDGTWTARVSVPEGHYIVYSESPHCSAESEQWVAVAGEPRHIVITINKSKVTTVDENLDANAVYGILPTGNADVEIMSADSAIGEQSRRAASIDGKLFQVGHLRPGRYVLRVAFGNVVASHEFTIPEDVYGAPDAYGAAVRVDFSMRDALSIVQQQASGSAFVDVPNYQNEKASTFRLGSAQAGGWTTRPLAKPSDYHSGIQRLSQATLAAVSVTQQFLSADNGVPAALRSLSGWELSVSDGNQGLLLILLSVIDLKAWSAANPAPVNCFLFSNPHTIKLDIDPKAAAVREVHICP